MKITKIEADGSKAIFIRTDSKRLRNCEVKDLADARELLRCDVVEVVKISGKYSFLVDEDAKLKGNLMNPIASQILMNCKIDEVIAGHAIFVTNSQLKEILGE